MNLNDNFFNSAIVNASQNQESNETMDPLFEKYSRKKLSRNSKIADNYQISSGIALYKGIWSEAEVNHLLKRVSFGASKIDIDVYKKLSVSAAVDKLLNFQFTPKYPYPTPVNFYGKDLPDPHNVPYGADFTKSHFLIYDDKANSLAGYRSLGVKNWMLGVYINDTTSMREKLTDFWYHFIPINFDSLAGENSFSYVNDYRTLLRNNCIGNFKTLIKEISKSQGMLLYLNGQDSNANTPNENFARELLELFTIGKEINPENQKYTEDDIKAASKIFSGWRMQKFLVPYPTPVVFNPIYHNQENKQFSHNFNNTLIYNQLNDAGANEFDQFFDMLFAYQSITIAKYICRRLYRFFVYYDITTAIENEIITPLANLLVASNWEFRPVVEMLFKSEHFYDISVRGLMIKSPFDFVVGAIRTLKIETNLLPSDYSGQNWLWDYLRVFCYEKLEQGIGQVPTVSGWKAYYQEPTFYQNWITSITIQKRESFLDNLLYNKNIESKILIVNPISYVLDFPNDTIKDPNLLINALVNHLLPIDIDIKFKTDVLKKANLLNSQRNDSYWTLAWNDYKANPTNSTKKKIVEDRLKAVLNVILKLAEFQLM